MFGEGAVGRGMEGGGKGVWWERKARNGIAHALQLSNLRPTTTQWPDNKVEDGRGGSKAKEAKEAIWRKRVDLKDKDEGKDKS